MEEIWNYWMPINIPDGQYELIELCQTFDGVKLVFDNEILLITVHYKDELLSFRYCDEGDRWNTVDKVLASKGKYFFKNKLTFIVENSDFKNWYALETFNKWLPSEFEHHSFVTANDIIDVLALHSPTISIEELHT